MTDFGVCDSVIARFLQTRPSIFGSTDLIKSLEEVKGLGFDPSMTTFEAALMAKKCISKKLWNQKVDVFKKWGWSDEVVFQAFRSNPSLMLVSIDKFGEKGHSKGLNFTISFDERNTMACHSLNRFLKTNNDIIVWSL
ncbi:hypothetical protein P8452_16687 [Trifolium repens]|nr:hypothetical protein P8452_16687 [Trifolium repens]